MGITNWDNKQITPFTFYCQHVLPLVYDESLSYYEVLCKLQTKLNEVIKSQNDIQDTFQELLKFVNTQLEKFTKEQLEKWLNDGTLANLICNYLNIKITFNTTTEMIEKANVEIGNKVSTLGYYQIGDGGQADFIISNVPEDFSLQLKNGLYAVLVIQNDMNVKAFGCKDNNVENGNLINKALSLCDIIHGNNNEVYDVSETIIVNNHKTIYNLKIKIIGVMQNAIMINGRTNTLNNVKVNCNNLAQNGIIGTKTSIAQTPDLTIIKNCRVENCSGNGYDTGIIRTCWDNCYAVKCGIGFIVTTTDTEHGYLIAHDCIIGIKGYYATIIKSCHLWTVTTKQIGIYVPAYTRNFIVNNYFNDTNDIGIAFEKQSQFQVDNIILVNNTNAVGCTDENSRLLKFTGKKEDLTSLVNINIGSINGYFENVDLYNELPLKNNNRCVNVQQGNMITQNQIGSVIANPNPLQSQLQLFKKMFAIESNSIIPNFNYSLSDVKTNGYEREFTIKITFKTTQSTNISTDIDIFTINFNDYFSSLTWATVDNNLRTVIAPRIVNSTLYLYAPIERNLVTDTTVEIAVNVKGFLK
jgi:hypothetical protein